MHHHRFGPKGRKNIDTAVQVLAGVAAATPLLLAGSGVSTAVGAGAVIVSVATAVTQLMQVPGVERLFDRMLGGSGDVQPPSVPPDVKK
jgi:hypothetical protein